MSDTTLVVSNLISLIFGAVAVVAAVGIAFYTQLISTVQSDVEDLQQTLDDKTLVARTLRLVLTEAGVRVPCPVERWFDAVDNWSSREGRPNWLDRTSLGAYARRLGPADFARLAYAKAKEQGVIIERETWHGDELIMLFDFNRPQA